jgi:hypothetical protein
MQIHGAMDGMVRVVDMGVLMMDDQHPRSHGFSGIGASQGCTCKEAYLARNIMYFPNIYQYNYR